MSKKSNDEIRDLHKDPLYLQIMREFYYAQDGEDIRQLRSQGQLGDVLKRWEYEPTTDNIVSKLSEKLKVDPIEIKGRLENLKIAGLVETYNGTPGRLYQALGANGIKIVERKRIAKA